MPRWFDIRNPHNRFGVGQIEVEGDFITKASPAYRWAVGRHFETEAAHWYRSRFILEERSVCNSKSFNRIKRPVVGPSDSQLYKRVSP